MAGNSPITSGFHEIMNEQSEIPQKEQYVMSPELEKAIHGAKERVQTEAKQPEQDILERTAGMGFVSAMKEATKPHLKEIGSTLFKDFKASVMAVISLIPIISTGGTAARAAGKAARADIKYGSLTTEAEKVIQAGKSAKNLEKGISKASRASAEGYHQLRRILSPTQLTKYNELVAQGLHAGAAARAALLPVERLALLDTEIQAGIKIGQAFEHASKGINTTVRWAPFGEKAKLFGKKVEVPTGKLKFGARIGAERVAEGWFHELLHTLDPYPDVPGLVSLVGFLDLIPGVVGAELVPAAWQMIADNVQRVKAEIGMAKDVTKVVLSRMGVKLDKLKEPKVARAAEMFLPSTATAIA